MARPKRYRNGNAYAEQIIQMDFRLQPKQRQLFQEYDKGRATIVGFGGSRGGSKSHGGRSLMIYRRMKYPMTSGYIIRKTLDDLRDNHLRPLLRIHPELEPYWKSQEKIIEFPNSSTIRFVSGEHDEDIYRLAGKEADDIFIDQSEQFRWELIEFLTTINRGTTNPDITSKMLLGFNPGGVSHSDHKRVFVNRDFVRNEVPENYSFLRAFGWDNVEWSRKALMEDKLTASAYYSWTDEVRKQYFITRTDYGKKLNALPDSQRKAQLEGDFDVFEGQFFSSFRRDMHVIPAFMPLPAGWMYTIGLDYGQRTAMEICARTYEGDVLFVGECYTEHMSPIERAQVCADYLVEWMAANDVMRPLRMYYDTNMDINLKEYYGYDKTPAQTFRDVFKIRMGKLAPIMTVVSKHATDKRGYRIICNEAFQNALYFDRTNPEAKPKMRFFLTCKHLVATLPELITDPSSQEGLDFDPQIGIDDPYDAAQYAYIPTLAPRRPIEAQRQTEAEQMLSRVFKRVGLTTRRNPVTY